jgi:non-specific serine/threonine protein kinase
VGPGSLQTFVRRDMEAEFQATRRLRALGFRMADPGRFEIEGDQALDFLRKDLTPLTSEWELYGQSDLKRYRVAPAPVSLRVRLGADIDWLDLALEAEVGDDLVPSEEILRALRKGIRYVRLGSGASALLPSEWLETVGPAVEELGLQATRARLPRYLAPLVEELIENAPEVEWGDRSAWDGLLAALRTSAVLPEAAVPRAFAGTLRPYQEEGYRWIRFMGALGFGCILADDMGLGKTVQALAVLSAEAEEGHPHPNLVVAPTSVVPNWEKEARRFAPGLRVLRYHGTDRKTRLESFEGHHMVVTSYAVLRRDIRSLGAVEWNYAVLDEAQAIKNSATQTARAVRRLKARRRLALTGTPLENHLGELWSQFQFLAPGLLGTERHFSRAFARPIAQGKQEVLGRLRRRIGPFVLRRLKTEVARDLPEKVESALLCEMEPAQERLYRSLLFAGRERVFREVAQKGLAQARFSVLETLLRLRQVCCHPEILPRGLGQGVPSAKFELFRHFVSEVVDEGHRVLVFSQFVSVLQILRHWFEETGIAHLYLDGRTRDREDRVRRFQEDTSVSAFLVSLKAGGSGLNLTGADYVVIYDPWWNPAVETQAADRAHRIGQSRKVFSYKMITRATVEEKILALQERKRDLTEDLIRTGPAWGAGLTEDDLEELFRV